MCYQVLVGLYLFVYANKGREAAKKSSLSGRANKALTPPPLSGRATKKKLCF